MFRDRFAPRNVHRYVASLDKEIAPSVRSGFCVSDDLRFVTEVDSILLTGTIQCEGGIRVEIEERSRILRKPWWQIGSGELVELVFYRYNAVFLNRGTIFRYNSPHRDHRQFHHVHRCDVFGSGAEAVVQVNERDVPSIRQVLVEAESWYWSHLRA